MYNQFPCKIKISTTLETTPMYIGGEFYPHYPYITQDLIGSDTSNIFIDTLNISNVFLKRIIGDYDGDQVSVKGAYTNEANDELDKFIKSKANYIGLDGKCTFVTTNESIQSMYNLTKVLSSQSGFNEMEF